MINLQPMIDVCEVHGNRVVSDVDHFKIRMGVKLLNLQEIFDEVIRYIEFS
jgi:hypothetical protein